MRRPRPQTSQVIDLRPGPQSAPGALLEESQAILQAILTSVVDSVIVIDDDGTIISINPAAEDLLGYSEAELVGQVVDVIMPVSRAGSRHAFLSEHQSEPNSAVVGDCREVTIRRGDGSEASAEISITEVRVAGRHFFVGIARNIGARKQAEQLLRRQATTDPLTGLVNRSSLHRALAQSMVRVDEGHELAIVFLDLDGFKEINDTHGHPAGDRVLRIAAQRVRNAVRRDDLVGRYGGDELIVVIETDDDIERELDALIPRIRAAFEAPFPVGRYRQRIDISMGIAVHPTDGATIGQLINHADRAMYDEKRSKARRSAGRPAVGL